MIFELVVIDHTDYPGCQELEEVIDTVEAATELEAAKHFRAHNHLFGLVREQGSCLSRALWLIVPTERK